MLQNDRVIPSAVEAKPRRVAVFATHPIQYQAPWFRALGKEPGLDVHVLYAMLPNATQQGIGFGADFEWDIPLLDGYQWSLLENCAGVPSVDNFTGCRVSGLLRTLERLNPEYALITGWNSWFLVQALRACRRLNIPVLMRGDSNVLSPRNWIKKRIHKLLFRQVSAFLAVGELNRKLYENAGVGKDKIYFCPHFVDSERFAAQAGKWETERSVLRRAWGVPQEATCFLFVGKLVPKKRIIDFLDAIRLVNLSNSKKIWALIAGIGEEMERARNFAESENIPVTFAGFLNQREVVKAYVASDCLVLPSDYRETWGLVVNEAMSCGKPAVVSNDVGCGPDLVRQDQTGKLFKTGDIKALAGILEQLSSHNKQLKQMGENARELVRSRYSICDAVQGVKTAVNYLQGEL